MARVKKGGKEATGNRLSEIARVLHENRVEIRAYLRRSRVPWVKAVLCCRHPDLPWLDNITKNVAKASIPVISNEIRKLGARKNKKAKREAAARISKRVHKNRPRSSSSSYPPDIQRKLEVGMAKLEAQQEEELSKDDGSEKQRILAKYSQRRKRLRDQCDKLVQERLHPMDTTLDDDEGLDDGDGDGYEEGTATVDFANDDDDDTNDGEDEDEDALFLPFAEMAVCQPCNPVQIHAFGSSASRQPSLNLDWQDDAMFVKPVVASPPSDMGLGTESLHSEMTDYQTRELALDDTADHEELQSGNHGIDVNAPSTLPPLPSNSFLNEAPLQSLLGNEFPRPERTISEEFGSPLQIELVVVPSKPQSEPSHS